MIYIKKSVHARYKLIMILFFISCMVPSFSAAFTLFGKVNIEIIKLNIVNYLDENISKNVWDITIVTPKKINKNKETEIIVFYKIREKDFRSYVNVIYDGSNYNIKRFEPEENSSRHLAVPRKSSSLWLDVEDRTYPFKGIDSLELKCQLVENKGYVPAKPNDEIIINNEHIESIEPHRYKGEESYNIRIHLTAEGKRILNDVSKNYYSKKLGLKIGFISYTTQAIPRDYKYESIVIYTKYSLENTEELIESLLNKKQEYLTKT